MKGDQYCKAKWGPSGVIFIIEIRFVAQRDSRECVTNDRRTQLTSFDVFIIKELYCFTPN